MKLRKLETKDAPLMLEWMHDPSVVRYMHADFGSKTIDDCLAFIKAAEDMCENLHLAIADDNDEYQGTVSLKNIKDGAAEFAITIRSEAMGKGLSKEAMSEIIRIGFEELSLDNIYWCVDPSNKRAVRFYDKNEYERTNVKLLPECEAYTAEQKEQLIWYRVFNEGKQGCIR